MSKPVILVFASYYLPGFRAGGPIRSIVNIVERLNDDFEFRIVTSDRDLLSGNPFENIPINQWCSVGSAEVYYCSPEKQTVVNFSKIIKDVKFDVLYINSYFSYNFSIKPLIARYFRMVNAEVVILAPRGEFSGAALKLKSFKKKGFILFSKLLGLHKNVSWHASSKYEMEDIIQNIPVLPNKIFIAPNLSLPIKKNDINQKEVGKENTLRIVFLSRISPMKNLDFSLHVLKLVKGVIIFDIYGPAEDDEYWQKCCEIIGRLPDNISVNYHGAVKPEEVIEVFSTYDLFFFPTRGENYGHVIFEALSVGTPVMISDQTPWKNLKEKSLGWELPINTGYEPFVTLIESYVGMGIKERKSWREEIQNKMRNNGSDKKNIDANRQLFLHLL